MEQTNLDEFLAAIPPKRKFQSLAEHFNSVTTQKREALESRHKEEKLKTDGKRPLKEKNTQKSLVQKKSGLRCTISFGVIDSIITEDHATLQLVLLLYRKRTELNSYIFTISKKDRESYGLNRSSVSRSLSRLEAIGLVKLIKEPGSSTVVQLVGF